MHGTKANATPPNWAVAFMATTSQAAAAALKTDVGFKVETHALTSATSRKHETRKFKATPRKETREDVFPQ